MPCRARHGYNNRANRGRSGLGLAIRQQEGRLMRAIQVTRHGGPEVLGTTDLPLPEPGSGEVRIRLEAAGVYTVWHGTVQLM